MTNRATRKEIDDFFRRYGFDIPDADSAERKLLACGPCGLPECCTYHHTGGLSALGCGGDVYAPEEPEKPGPQFRRGFNGGWQP